MNGNETRAHKQHCPSGWMMQKKKNKSDTHIFYTAGLGPPLVPPVSPSKIQLFHITGAINGPACIELLPIDSRIARRLSSQARSALSNCTILSRLPCRTSLMLTAPILTSFSSKKSNSLNKPSSFSSSGSLGKALSGAVGLRSPLTDSAMRSSSSPPQIEPRDVICSELGRWLLAHSIRSGSTKGC
jgi:hypothetical protein